MWERFSYPALWSNNSIDCFKRIPRCLQLNGSLKLIQCDHSAMLHLVFTTLLAFDISLHLSKFNFRVADCSFNPFGTFYAYTGSDINFLSNPSIFEEIGVRVACSGFDSETSTRKSRSLLTQFTQEQSLYYDFESSSCAIHDSKKNLIIILADAVGSIPIWCQSFPPFGQDAASVVL